MSTAGYLAKLKILEIKVPISSENKQIKKPAFAIIINLKKNFNAASSFIISQGATVNFLPQKQ